MSLDFLTWLICFVLQAALLGIIMYGLICLSDLENDFINPHDASATINKWVLPEYVLQGSMTALLLLTGKWFAGALHACCAIYNARTFLRGDHVVDATDIFQQVGFQKNIRIGKLVLYLASFVLIIYRLVETAVHALLTAEHRDAAHRIVQEAAASFKL